MFWYGVGIAFLCGLLYIATNTNLYRSFHKRSPSVLLLRPENISRDVLFYPNAQLIAYEQLTENKKDIVDATLAIDQKLSTVSTWYVQHMHEQSWNLTLALSGYGDYAETFVFEKESKKITLTLSAQRKRTHIHYRIEHPAPKITPNPTNASSERTSKAIAAPFFTPKSLYQAAVTRYFFPTASTADTQVMPQLKVPQWHPVP